MFTSEQRVQASGAGAPYRTVPTLRTSLIESYNSSTQRNLISLRCSRRSAGKKMCAIGRMLTRNKLLFKAIVRGITEYVGTRYLVGRCFVLNTSQPIMCYARVAHTHTTLTPDHQIFLMDNVEVLRSLDSGVLKVVQAAPVGGADPEC